MDFQLFCKAGEGVLGPDWHRPLARELGRLHPDGPREEIDPRTVRRWAKGERSIPDWVSTVLIAIAQENIDLYVPKLAALEKLQRELRALGGDDNT